MIHNQKGNALITVLLISLVFTIIGLAIISSSISGTKRTENRKTDIDVSYNAIKVVGDITTNITNKLNTLSLKSYMTRSGGQTTIDPTFDPKLQELLKDSLTKITDNEKAKIECLSLVDESGASASEIIGSSGSCVNDLSKFSSYQINKDNDFTRVFEIVLVTKNPNKNEGKIQRTIRKRFILSPLPSFLKYAVGSYGEGNDFGLVLNGSPNIYGNVYANQLTISENANYQLRDGSDKTSATPMPSINGDLYSSTANLLPIVKEKEHFYKGEIPELKNDSQFININFRESFDNQMNDILVEGGLGLSWDGDRGAFQTDLLDRINAQYTENNRPLSDFGIIKKDGKEAPINLPNGVTTAKDSYIMGSTPPIVDPISVNGDLVIMSSGNDITLDQQLVVKGDLYIVSYQNINLSNIYVTGDIHIVNFGGTILLNGNIVGANNIDIESSGNSGQIEVNGVVICGNKLTMGASANNDIIVNADILAGNNIMIKPIDTSININKNIATAGSLTINGNDELAVKPIISENDEVIFDSVVYVENEASISNVNILGTNDNEKQLILLANGKLTITRINEFKNFQPSKESAKPYLPEKENTIKPLKAFFYTESNAILYGVGSLFYIDGGLFAKDRLEINAIRGEVTDIKDLPPSLTQTDMYSRFIVNYNSDILLQRIEALPIVDHLQIYSDELIVE
ncbi:hypothetical protein JK635_03080 [Neobacillus sp. YIM B02564]|uniref:Polymer-forming cytoskeletal protein n=1 Tax=Neobacillus paridis TaxID=2803862 RepID=A0ABS1TKE0_9BACI|nr:hypothetical protein [Neobacillus paridis]MBL4951224.1 hypothetical protein [Neobacillus paridis]